MITRRTFIAGSAAAGVVVGSSSAHAAGARGAHAAASAAPLTNLAHLRWLLDSVPLQASSIHTTYDIAARPTSLAPWTYADAQTTGGWRRVGGGSFDSATGHWSQGAYNADDIARAAVVFVRNWLATGDVASRHEAQELLRTLTFLQDATGPVCRQRGALDAGGRDTDAQRHSPRAARPVRQCRVLLARPHRLGTGRGVCGVRTRRPRLRRLPG